MEQAIAIGVVEGMKACRSQKQSTFCSPRSPPRWRLVEGAAPEIKSIYDCPRPWGCACLEVGVGVAAATNTGPARAASRVAGRRSPVPRFDYAVDPLIGM